MSQILQDHLSRLDELTKLSSVTSLEWGWVANEYFESEKNDLIAQFGSERAALTETITFLQQRYATTISARSTVADRMRVTRWMTREKYDELYAETRQAPSFHQVRACLATDHGEIIESESEERLMWCVENEWPSVQEIREHFDDTNMSPDERLWRRFVDLAQRVVARFENRNNRLARAGSLVLAADEAENGQWETTGSRFSA